MAAKTPCRLFVAGVHGNEEATTMHLMEFLARDIENRSGRLILFSLSSANPYISTLDKAYCGMQKNNITVLASGIKPY